MGQYSITLSSTQRQSVEHSVKAGTAPARSILHAQVLLKADEGPGGPKWSDHQIEEAFLVSYRTILRIRQRFVQEGLEAALHRRKQPTRPQKRTLDGEAEARLVALLCQQTGEGESVSYRVLATRLVELEIVQSVSHETVRQVVKKTT